MSGAHLSDGPADTFTEARPEETSTVEWGIELWIVQMQAMPLCYSPVFELCQLLANTIFLWIESAGTGSCF